MALNSEISKKIVFVGGHHTPALAVITALKKLETPESPFDIYWVGHRFSIWKDTNDSAEYKEVTALKIPFFDLKAGKFYRTYNPLKLIRIPLGFIQSFVYLSRLQPDLVVTFGGYLSVPMAFSAYLLKIPVITHEQTVTSGLANRFVASFARLILLTWSQSQAEFPKNKSEVIGLPLREELVAAIRSKTIPNQLSSKPLIYITGGKQGSHSINDVVFQVLPQLLQRFKVIHQCGGNSINNEQSRFTELKNQLIEPSDYQVSDYYNAAAVVKILNESAIVISRSGANTTYELMAFGKPSILIPLPAVSHNEQYLQAEVLRKFGAAIIINQVDLSPETLLNSIDNMVQNLKVYQDSAASLREEVCLDAAEKFSQRINSILNETKI